jgi:hypothetical protein
LGSWKFRAEGKGGKALDGEGEFRPDGTFIFQHPAHPLKGRYAYANGVLWLIVEHAFASAKPVWCGKESFSVRMGDADLTFHRTATESEAEEGGS